MKKADVGAVNPSTFKSMCTCQAPLENIAFCSQCVALNSIEPTSPFQVFGLQESFFIDRSFLNKIYFDLQNKLHPDRFSSHDEERALAEHYSSYLNWAYQVLKDPFKRAEILLKDFPSSVSQIDLMEQMEKHEYLESLSSRDTLSAFESRIMEEKNKIENEMVDFFKEKNHEKAKYCLARFKYFDRLLREVLVKKEGL